jgi:predicted transcriptional regulator
MTSGPLRPGRREPIEIRAAILKICRESTNKTAIVYNAGLSFRSVNPYLEQLIKSGHLEIFQLEKQTRHKATERGRELEKRLWEILEDLES